MKKKAKVKKPKTVTCGVCYGNKRVGFVFGLGHEIVRTTVECKACRGSGKIFWATGLPA